MKCRRGPVISPPSVPPASRRTNRRIDQEMLSAETLDEVPLTFSTEPATTPPGEPGVHVVLNLDVAHLQLVNRSGMRTEQLTVIAALLTLPAVSSQARNVRSISK